MKNNQTLELKNLEVALLTQESFANIPENQTVPEYTENKVFFLTKKLAGLALRIYFANEGSLLINPSGIRRTVQIICTDKTVGKVICQKDIKVNISKSDYYDIIETDICFNEFSFFGDHIIRISFIERNHKNPLAEYEYNFMPHPDSRGQEIKTEPEITLFDRLLDDWRHNRIIDFNNDEKEKDTAGQDFLDSLNSLTGLDEVKTKLSNYEKMVSFNKLRNIYNLPGLTQPLHSVFMGSPGTGKTTVAKMMGEMLHKKGLLSKGHVVVKERATLLGQNYNSEAEHTLAAIEEAQGGILFIDEAYQLFQPQDARDPGKFVLETLLTALSDPDKKDWMLILAGYSKEIMRMLDLNPGFKSRIPEANYYNFYDFTISELMQIAENFCIQNEFCLSTGARKALAQRIKKDTENKDSSFGNARYVLNLIQTEIIPAMAVRVLKEKIFSKENLTLIKEEDIINLTVKRSIEIQHRIGYVA